MHQYLRYVNRSLTCHKILWHGVYGFTSPPKESVLQIFIALRKYPLPWLRLSLQPLGPVASTLTTTPPSDIQNTGTGWKCSWRPFNCLVREGEGLWMLNRGGGWTMLHPKQVRERHRTRNDHIYVKTYICK
jgi:hypothetical protein